MQTREPRRHTVEMYVYAIIG